jgi:methyltransferase (TIGR00027 family)
MRTEGDSWDITTSVGSTALFVAAARALGGRAGDALAVDPYAEVFLRAAGGDWAALMDGNLPDHPLLAPGFGHAFQQHQIGRTRYFDDYLRTALGAGVRQVVILAAGLDSRAYRLPWPDGTVLYELDREPVLAFKRETVAAADAKPRTVRREVAVDLREDWPASLRAHGFDPSEPTAWLVEGLLIYLPPEAQEQLFDTIDQLSAPGSRVAIEQMDPLPEEVATGMAENLEQEPSGVADWVRLIYNQPRDEAAAWFRGRGWTADQIYMPDYLREQDRALPEPDPSTASQISLVTALRP